MSERSLVAPEFTVEHDTHSDEARITFRVPGSRLGSVVVVLSDDDAEKLAALLSGVPAVKENER